MAEKKWCFPEAREFVIQYRELMRDKDDYMGEKTTPTMVKWLAGQTMINYDVVPAYAQYDYEKYFEQDANSPMIRLVRMTAESNMEKMKEALDAMAIPC